jgi:tetratricopeptide (TPR) repeat protein
MGYYMRLGQQDHWQLLGVDRDADVSQVRERFLGILDEMPPEKLHLLGDSMREKAEEVHEALKLAYNTITEPKSLKTYMVKVEMRRRTQERAQLQRAQPQHEAEPSRTVDLWEQADAERPSVVPVFMPGAHQDDEIGQNRTLRAFQVARKAVEEGRWKEAFHAAKTAAQFDPNNSEVTVLMAWVVYNLPHDDKSRQYKVCRQRIENELALNNAIPDAYLYLGRMEEDQRELRQALEHYRMALGLDPKHPAARKAIERLQRHPMLAKAETAPAHEDANLLNRLKGFFGR